MQNHGAALDLEIRDLSLNNIPDQSVFGSAQPPGFESGGFGGELSRTAESKLDLRIFESFPSFLAKYPASWATTW